MDGGTGDLRDRTITVYMEKGKTVDTFIRESYIR
jgi:hypothetical protein